MGFLRKQKKATEPKSAPSASVTREEFRRAAMEGFTEAAREQETAALAEVKTDSVKSEEAKSEQPAAKTPQKKKTRWSKRILTAVLIILMVFVLSCAGLYVYGLLTLTNDRIAHNVYVENINLGGLTRDEAIKRLENEDVLSERTVTLTCNAHEFTIRSDEAGITANAEDCADEAFKVCKQENQWYNAFENAMLLFMHHTVAPQTGINENVLREKIAEFGTSIYGEKTEHSLALADGEVICTPGHSGFDGNTDTAYNQISQAISSKHYTIPVTLSAAPPKDITVSELNNFVYCDPANAYYSSDSGSIAVVDEVDGRYLDLFEAEEKLSQLTEGGETITVPYYTTEPETTALELGTQLYNAVLGTYSTSFGKSAASRCANIANAAAKLNGKELLPGEVISFNDTVGPRSVANGFYTAREYDSSDLTDSVGGGCCQVAATLYNAALYSNLSIVARTNNTFPVSYCPEGQDAFVSDSGADLKFVNNTSSPIKISTEINGYTLTITIYGTERKEPLNIEIENTPTHIGSDTSVHSVRHVYNADGELIQTDDLGNSYYMTLDK